MRRLRSIGGGRSDQVDPVLGFERLCAPVELGVVALTKRDRFVIGDLEGCALPARVIDVRGFHAALATAIGSDDARAPAQPLKVRKMATLDCSLAAVLTARAGVDAHHATTRYFTMSEPAS